MISGEGKAGEGTETLSFRVTRVERGERLDRFLRRRVPWRSRTGVWTASPGATRLERRAGAPFKRTRPALISA